MLENVVKNIQNASTIENTKEKFLCEKFVPICENGLTMISASGGTGKSLLVAQIALRIAIEKKQFKCLLWLSEDSKNTTKNRLNDILKNILKKSSQVLNRLDVCNEIPRRNKIKRISN